MNDSQKYKLAQVIQFKGENKFSDALNLIKTLEHQDNLTLKEKFDICYLKGSLLSEQGFFDKALESIESAIKISKKLTEQKNIIDVLIVKTTILTLTLGYKEAHDTIKNAEIMLNSIESIPPMLHKEKKGYILCKKSDIFLGEGNLTLSLKFTEEGYQIAVEIKNKKLLALFNELLGKITSLRGDFNKALYYHKISLEFAEEIDDKQIILCALNNIGLNLGKKEEFQQAITILTRSITLCEEVSSYKTPAVLHTFCEIAIELKDPEKVRDLLNRFEIFAKKREYKIIYGYNAFLATKAMVLKTSQNLEDKDQAKEILRNVLKADINFFQVGFDATFHLCDLLLEELHSTNNTQIIHEIQAHLQKILNIAKNQKSFWLLVEVYIFQAKLKLIMFEFKEVQQLLTQAYEIAEKYEQNLLANRITAEQEELSKNYLKWEKMKKSSNQISERMELARIGEQIETLLQKRKYLELINNSKQ